MSNKSARVLAALATLGADERFTLVVVTSQMLLQVILVLEPALAVGPWAFNTWPTFLEMQPNVLLENSLILDFFAAHMAHVRSLAVLHAYVNLHVVFSGKANNMVDILIS